MNIVLLVIASILAVYVNGAPLDHKRKSYSKIKIDLSSEESSSAIYDRQVQNALLNQRKYPNQPNSYRRTYNYQHETPFTVQFGEKSIHLKHKPGGFAAYFQDHSVRYPNQEKKQQFVNKQWINNVPFTIEPDNQQNMQPFESSSQSKYDETTINKMSGQKMPVPVHVANNGITFIKGEVPIGQDSQKTSSQKFQSSQKKSDDKTFRKTPVKPSTVQVLSPEKKSETNTIEKVVPKPMTAETNSKATQTETELEKDEPELQGLPETTPVPLKDDSTSATTTSTTTTSTTTNAPSTNTTTLTPANEAEKESSSQTTVVRVVTNVRTVLFQRDFNLRRNLIAFAAVVSMLTVAMYSLILICCVNSTNKTKHNSNTNSIDSANSA